MTRAPIAALMLGLVATAAHGDDGDLRRLFSQRADVFVPPPGGLSRLTLGPEVLSTCRPDLSDLRVFDARGREVAYVVDAGPAPRGRLEVAERAEASILEVRRDEIAREHAPTLRRETYVVAAPAKAPEAGAWELVFETARAGFVRRVDVTVEAADGPSARLVENGSLFRLPNAAKDKTRLALPPLPGGRLTVALEGEDGFYLEPRLVFESARSIGGREEAVVTLEEIAREQHDGRTIVELARPRGLMPDVLRLETTSGSFDRAVEVWDEGPTGEGARLGRGQLFRVQALAAVEDRELPLAPARGERLRVEIVDGDSTPLETLSFTGLVRQPALVFSLAAESDERPAGTLFFGGGRAYRPDYDLAGLLALVGGTLTGDRARAAERLHDPAQALPARLGAIRSNPALDAAPALAFAMRPGAKVDPRLYTHRRPLTVTPSPEGLSRLELAPEDLVHTRPDLGDLRVVDSDGRQWPYLLEPDAARRWDRLELQEPTRRRRASRYQLRPAVSPVRLDQLVLEADASFFDRPFQLTATIDGRASDLATGRLAQPIGKPGPVTIAFAASRVDALALVVEDGDDAPLVFRAARARVLLPALFLTAPAGKYELLVGDPRATGPSYELARIREVVLAVRSVPVVAGAAGRNPRYSAVAHLTTGDRMAGVVSQVLLWSVLVAAVIVLTGLTLRLARASGPSDGG